MIYLNRTGLIINACLFILANLLAGQSSALVSLSGNKNYHKKVLQRELLADGRVPDSARFENSSIGSLSDFNSKYGNKWYFEWDKITLTPTLAAGEGITLLQDGMQMSDVEGVSRRFIDENANLFGVGSANLVLRQELTRNAGPYNEMWFVHFYQYYKGLPVINSNIFLRFKFARLLQFGSESFPDINIDVEPQLSANNAMNKAMEAVGYDMNGDRVQYDPVLVVYPVLFQGSYIYKLAYRTIFLKASPYGEWVVYLDANDGRVIEKYTNTYYFEGRLIGRVHTRLATDSYVDLPLPNVSVNISGRESTLTDWKGLFGARVSQVSNVSMNIGGPNAISRQCNTVYIGGGDEYARCDSVATRVVFSGSDAWDNQDIVLFELDDSNTSSAERDSYFHINNVRAWARRFIRIDWFNTALNINVNIRQMVENTYLGEKTEAAACNAFWDGRTVNFFVEGETDRSGRKLLCNNTANIADIIYHEWGHGLDQNTGGIDDAAFSEGIADIVAFMMTSDPYIAPSFFQTGQTDGVTYIREVLTKKIYPRDKNSDPHIESLIISSTWWDLRSYLIERYGERDGSDKASFLFLNHLFTAQTYRDSYNATLMIDDDNGNLADGTPNAGLIRRAFFEHGLAK